MLHLDPPAEPLTAHLRRLHVQLDPEQYPGADGELVYERARHQGPHLSEISVRCAPPLPFLSLTAAMAEKQQSRKCMCRWWLHGCPGDARERRASEPAPQAWPGTQAAGLQARGGAHCGGGRARAAALRAGAAAGGAAGL